MNGLSAHVRLGTVFALPPGKLIDESFSKTFEEALVLLEAALVRWHLRGWYVYMLLL